MNRASSARTANRRGTAVVSIKARFPAHGVEIGDLHLVPGLLQMLHGKIFKPPFSERGSGWA
ncbi:hypothetical protein DMH27_17985 [Raoultella planticola]|nr:hypothetical protein [Raoultella planticola]